MALLSNVYIQWPLLAHTVWDDSQVVKSDIDCSRPAFLQAVAAVLSSDVESEAGFVNLVEVESDLREFDTLPIGNCYSIRHCFA